MDNSWAMHDLNVGRCVRMPRVHCWNLLDVWRSPNRLVWGWELGCPCFVSQVKHLRGLETSQAPKELSIMLGALGAILSSPNGSCL